MKYRKKPIIVDAFKWTGGEDQTPDPEWLVEALRIPKKQVGSAWIHRGGNLIMFIQVNPDKTISVLPGEWILRDANGKTWPEAPDIFEATYEPVEGQ